MTTLVGCSSAHVTEVATTRTGGPSPVEILVAMDASPAAQDPVIARMVADKLQAELVKGLTEQHITAERFVPGTSHPGAVVLHVSVTQADPGSFVERFVIGFGAGRARLQVKADLVGSDAAGAPSVTSFSTTGDSGRKPGLILPGGVALATHDIVHLAIGGGIKLATSFNDDLDAPTGKTAEAIVTQLQKYYATAGWYWPATA